MHLAPSAVGSTARQSESHFTQSLESPLRTVRRAGVAMAALSLLLFSACSSDSPTDADGPKSIAIALSPISATISLGGSTELTATVTRLGGFIGAVDVTVEDLTEGLTSSVTNLQTANGITPVTVSLSASTAATTGVHSLTLRATSYGVTAATTFTLTVTAVP